MYNLQNALDSLTYSRANNLLLLCVDEDGTLYNPTCIVQITSHPVFTFFATRTQAHFLVSMIVKEVTDVAMIA